MYVTRRISILKNKPGALLEPPIGPNSGYLVIWDVPPTYTCFGLCEDTEIKHLPFPQDKNLTITYATQAGDHSRSNWDKILFIPVLNQPLSSNRYYVIRRQGKHQGTKIFNTEDIKLVQTIKGMVKNLPPLSLPLDTDYLVIECDGQASTSSKEEDKTTCLCCSLVNDVKPRPLVPSDDYQQVKIINKRHGFQAISVASDGIPQYFLRRKGWKVEASNPRNYHLDEALGSNDSLRAKLPDFNFPLSNASSESVEVGKWYCPFMFLKEGMKLKEQMKMSMFYEVILVQRWEKIFSKENGNNRENTVLVDVAIQTEVVKVAGRDAVWDENGVVDKVLWFRSFDDVGKEISVGSSLEVVERMKWEQERFGWKESNGRQESVARIEEFRGANKWKKFGCYMLVESFIFRRMDGGLVLTYDFSHTHHIICKWE